MEDIPEGPYLTFEQVCIEFDRMSDTKFKLMATKILLSTVEGEVIVGHKRAPEVVTVSKLLDDLAVMEYRAAHNKNKHTRYKHYRITPNRLHLIQRIMQDAAKEFGFVC